MILCTRRRAKWYGFKSLNHGPVVTYSQPVRRPVVDAVEMWKKTSQAKGEEGSLCSQSRSNRSSGRFVSQFCCLLIAITCRPPKPSTSLNGRAENQTVSKAAAPLSDTLSQHAVLILGVAQTRWRGHMKPETSEHLNKVEGAIHGAKRLLGKDSYPDTMRTVLLSVHRSND